MQYNDIRSSKSKGINLVKMHTFCISPLETKDCATFSKLSFKTSVIAAVIASACTEGMPCASSLLTWNNHSNNLRKKKQEANLQTQNNNRWNSGIKCAPTPRYPQEKRDFHLISHAEKCACNQQQKKWKMDCPFSIYSSKRQNSYSNASFGSVIRPLPFRTLSLSLYLSILPILLLDLRP